MKSIFMVVGVCVLTGGCAAAWGSSFNVASSNSSAVSIEYDPSLINTPGMLQAAQSACDKFGKDAVLANTSPGVLGILVNTYRCEKRS